MLTPCFYCLTTLQLCELRNIYRAKLNAWYATITQSVHNEALGLLDYAFAIDKTSNRSRTFYLRCGIANGECYRDLTFTFTEIH